MTGALLTVALGLFVATVFAGGGWLVVVSGVFLGFAYVAALGERRVR